MSKNLSEKESEVRIVGKETQWWKRGTKNESVIENKEKNREKMRGAKIRVL